jgi:hypothetical protein
MTAVAKSGTPSPSTASPSFERQVWKGKAGEALTAGDACYVKSDGKAWLATGAAANAAAKVVGFVMGDTPVNEAVTLYDDITLNYGSGLTPGALYYLSGTTAGGLDTAASTGGTKPIAFAVDATRIRVRGSWRD